MQIEQILEKYMGGYLLDKENVLCYNNKAVARSEGEWRTRRGKADREIEALANLFIKNSLDKSSEM